GVWANLYGSLASWSGSREVQCTGAGRISLGAVLLGRTMVSTRELPGVGRRPRARCHAMGSGGARGQLRLSPLQTPGALGGSRRGDLSGRHTDTGLDADRGEPQRPSQAPAEASLRTGMQTTALIVQVGERRICLYYTGRRHAGENLAALLAHRELQREK